MSVLETASSVQVQVLDAIKSGQDAVLSVVQNLVEKTAPLADKLPASPFADQLPNGADVIDQAFSFAEKLLASQKEFATKLIEAYVPATAPKPATKAATKAA